jgi:phosphatidylinositol glycan class B
MPGRVHSVPIGIVASAHVALSSAWPRSIALISVLAIAFLLRLWLVLTHTYVLFPDETFQYLEPGHRLAFGSGLVAWEYIDGIRSWLLPGAIAAVMRLVALANPTPHSYVLAVRLCCVVASLALPYVGFRLGERYGGLAGGIVSGLLAGLWYEAVYYAPVVMTEPLAAYASVLAFWLGEQPAPVRRLVMSGVLLGLASCLRYQYAPALALAALCQHVRNHRALLMIGTSGLATVIVGAGLLDALTWGMPFQSIWLNFQRNAIDQVGSAMGTEPWWFTLAYFLAAWGWAAPLLGGLAMVGATQMPALAVAAIVTLGLHALSPHKEVRFIFLAIGIAPLLVGVGLARLRRAKVATAVATAALIAGTEAAFAFVRATPADAWHRNESALSTFAAARAMPAICGLGVRSLGVFRTGGYTYLHRDVPIYFETFERAQHLPGSDFRMRIRVILDGQTVPQFPDAAFAGASTRFNALIGREDDALPGFSRVACFGDGSPGDERLCLFRRPGGCE